MNAEKKKGHGCLFWGLIIAGLLGLCMLLMVYAGYRYIKGVVAEYTDTKPIEAPALQLSSAEVTNLQQGLRTFNQAMESNNAVAPLTLTADEINALIANE